MKTLLKLALLLSLFLVFAKPAHATTCGPYTITGTCHYAATTGSDSNGGMSTGSSWLTPNHSLNCDDMILFAIGNYPHGNFEHTFGTVTGSGHCVAFAACAAFDACYSIGTGVDPTNGIIWVSTSRWAVVGFEVQNPSATSGNASCFKASPLSAATITDIYFINDVANGCGLGGFVTAPYFAGGSYGVDYFIAISTISYNAAQASAQCASGISVFEPVNYDTNSGTHIYVAQYFGWGNVDPKNCGGSGGTGPATDGEGIIFDTFGNFGYTGQAAAENNLCLYNGTNCAEVFSTNTAPIYIQNNTGYGDGIGTGLSEYCGEFVDQNNSTSPLNSLVTIAANIAKTKTSTACGSNPYYAYLAGNVNSANYVKGNFGYSAAGNSTNCWGTCTGFSFGPGDSFGTDPGFASAPSRTPAAPSCGSYANVQACVAALIADMAPSASGTSGLGYQPVSATSIYDPLFPNFLCPYQSILSGLVTPGCSYATPAFSLAAGTYTGTQNVTLTSTSGAVICWSLTATPTTNAGTGCARGTLYTGPVPVSSTATLKAVSGGTNYTDSIIASAAYTILRRASPTVRL